MGRSRVRSVHHNRGYRAVLTHGATRAKVREEAGRVARLAGPGFDAQEQTTIRARATVMPVTPEAKRANAEQNRLMRAVSAARR